MSDAALELAGLAAPLAICSRAGGAVGLMAVFWFGR